MFNSQLPPMSELPTSRQLVRSTLIAGGVAAVLLATVVLPAEYGVDPTGIGRAIGLTQMGEIKTQLHEEADRDAAADRAAATRPATIVDAAPAATAAATAQTETVRITLAPGEGQEVKADMAAGDKLTYRWSTGGPEVRFELHGEEKGAPADAYTSYEKGASAGESGDFQAPFDGTHGWFWRNRTTGPVTITVTATGTFRSFAAKPKS
jgi:hypothetical protein